ncbi:hypothetical protein ACJ7K1_03735 [Paenibacillus elgii]
MRKNVYNLEFESYVTELNIHGYRFYRVENYTDKVVHLHHLIRSFSEVSTQPNCGSHQITGFVDIPENEDVPVFDWGFKGTALDDILLLLSMFTLRDVFVVEETLTEGDLVITADPRQYQWGGILRCSLPYVESAENVSKNRPFKYNCGFEQGICNIYSLIRTEEWRRKYNNGYFLLLLKNALKRQILESSFIQCWTIWEHLFSVLNRSWLSKEQIIKISSDEKIAFILTEYALKMEISEADRKKIKALSQIRNRLVHYGRFPEKDSVTSDAQLFIRLTEFVVSKTLQLTPSNVLNTLERLEEYFNTGTST